MGLVGRVEWANSRLRRARIAPPASLREALRALPVGGLPPVAQRRRTPSSLGNDHLSI